MPGCVPVPALAGALQTDRVVLDPLRGGGRAYFAFLSLSVEPLALLAFEVDGALLLSLIDDLHPCSVAGYAEAVLVGRVPLAGLRASGRLALEMAKEPGGTRATEWQKSAIGSR